MMSLLEIKNLHVDVDGKKILNGLDLVVEKSNWHQGLAPRVGRGVCVQPAFGSFVATVVEAEVDEQGEVRGYDFSPLYKSVPFAARRDEKLYELLALVDAIRDGAVASGELVIRELRVRLWTQSANGRVLNLPAPSGARLHAARSRAATSKLKRGGNG